MFSNMGKKIFVTIVGIILFNFPDFFRQKEEWSCDVCVQDVGLVALAYSPEYGVPGMVEALRGEAFCQNPALDLAEEQVQVCQEIVGNFMPPAMFAITNAWVELSREICRDWFDGVCP